MIPTLLRRKAISVTFVLFCAASVALALVPLALILFFVLKEGLSSVNAAFFTQTPRPVGEAGGGMGNAIVGTLMMLGIAASGAVPVGILAGIFLSEYRKSALTTAARFCADVLNGVPSIVIGIFAYCVAVLPFRRFSALAGGVALGMMMIPLIVRTTEELLNLVPGTLREGALALGATRARAVFRVILPAALPGILTGVLVALARIAGETAPLLFTSLNNRYWSTRLDKPMASLTVQVYTYANSPYDDWHRQAWAGATVLIGAVLLFSILARFATARLERMQRP
jgi:phosphate transport system permease protein